MPVAAARAAPATTCATPIAAAHTALHPLLLLPVPDATAAAPHAAATSAPATRT